MTDTPLRIVVIAIAILCLAVASIEGQLWATAVAAVSFMAGYSVKALRGAA